MKVKKALRVTIHLDAEAHVSNEAILMWVKNVLRGEASGPDPMSKRSVFGTKAIHATVEKVSAQVIDSDKEAGKNAQADPGIRGVRSGAS